MFFECRHVTKYFGSLAAVDNVSFSLERGQTLGIMGPNGAGKSTLMNLIMGVYSLSKGDVYFDGEKISGLSTSTISSRGIGRTYQIPQPFPTMTVLENLLVGDLYAGRHGSMKAGRERARQILDQVNLSRRENTVGAELGLLDLKRLELAKALSLNPKLLLLDEIAGGLIDREVDELQYLLDDLKKSGMTLIIIEHVLNVMFAHSDKILVLNFGQPLAEGKPDEIVKNEQVIEVYLGEEAGPKEDDDDIRQAAQTKSQERPLLQISNLNAGYGSFQALFDVSLDIYKGEIVGLIGLNGAGKSTLIRAISRQIRWLSGDIVFKDRSLASMQPHDVTGMGIAQCIEGRKIFPRMTVKENLEIGAYPTRARQEREATLGRVFKLFPRLRERQAQLGGTLSGGEQQMLAIGRAIMSLPDLIIFDEISLGLAPLIIEDLYHAIREINAAGTTVFLVEQNVHRSLDIADRAFILERGRISLSGTSAELSQNKDVQEAYFGFEGH